MSSQEQTVGISYQLRSNVPEVMSASVVATREAHASAQQLGTGYENLVTQLRGAGVADQELVGALRQMGLTATEAREAVQGLAAAETQEAATAQVAAGGHANMQAMIRGTRLAVMGLVADMALAQVASGEQLPQGLREAANGLKTVADFAVAGGMAFGQWGAAIGAGAGLLLALGTAATGASPEIGALNKELDAIASKTEVATTLAKIMGWTDAEAEAALKASKHNHEFAVALDEVAKQREAPSWIQQLADAMGQISRAGGSDNPNLGIDLQAVQAQDAAAKKSEEAAKNANLNSNIQKEAWAEANKAESKYYDEAAKDTTSLIKLWDEESKRVSEFATQAARAGTQAANDRARAEEQAAQQSGKAWQTYNDSVARTERSLTEELAQLDQRRVSDAEKSAQDIDRIERSLNETLAKDAQSLADKEADINQRLVDRESDQAFQREQRLRAFDQQRLQQRQQLSDQLREIAYNEARTLAELAFHTGQQLAGSGTEHDRERIMQNYTFEVSMTEAKAQHATSVDEQRFTQEQRFAQMRVQLADETYQHELMVDQRTKDEELAKAQRSYREEVAAAKQRETDELRDLQARVAAENVALDNQAARDRMRAKDALDDAARRRAEELSNIQTGLANQENAINSRYAQEIARIDEAKTAFLTAEEEKEKKLKDSITLIGQEIAVIGQLATLGDLADLQTLISLPMNDRAAFIQKMLYGSNYAGSEGYARGGDFIVPPGYSNDRYPLRVSSGERVTVTPPNSSAPRGSVNITFNISHPNGDYIVEQVRRRLEHEAFQA